MRIDFSYMKDLKNKPNNSAGSRRRECPHTIRIFIFDNDLEQEPLSNEQQGYLRYIEGEYCAFPSNWTIYIERFV